MEKQLMIYPRWQRWTSDPSAFIIPVIFQYCLKGKFSSGIEGALASTLNRDFNWKQLSEMIISIFLLMFSKFFE